MSERAVPGAGRSVENVDARSINRVNELFGHQHVIGELTCLAGPNFGAVACPICVKHLIGPMAIYNIPVDFRTGHHCRSKSGGRDLSRDMPGYVLVATIDRKYIACAEGNEHQVIPDSRCTVDHGSS